MNLKKILKSIKKINKMNYDYAQFVNNLLVEQQELHDEIKELVNEKERLQVEINFLLSIVPKKYRN